MSFYKRYSEEDKKFLIDNHHLGIPYCAKILNRSEGSLHGLRHKLKLTLTHEQRSAVMTKAQERPDDWYGVNPAVFRDIRMPEVAYFLGYMWADGCVIVEKGEKYIIQLACLNRDYIKIAKDLAKIGEWKVYYHRLESNNKLVAQVRDHNKPLALWFVEQDYDNKSFVPPTKILAYLPEHLKHYFWRGFMDGDGCWKMSKRSRNFSFFAPYDYPWEEHSAQLDRLGIRWSLKKQEKTPDRFGRVSFLICSDLDGMNRWGEYLYQGYETDKIGLPRKYLKWKECHDKLAHIRFLKEFPLDIDAQQTLTKEAVYDAVKKYSGIISRERISTHFKVDYWKVRDLLRKLIKEGKIKYTDKSISRPCLYTAIDLSVREGTEQMP